VGNSDAAARMSGFDHHDVDVSDYHRFHPLSTVDRVPFGAGHEEASQLYEEKHRLVEGLAMGLQGQTQNRSSGKCECRRRCRRRFRARAASAVMTKKADVPTLETENIILRAALSRITLQEIIIQS
jgi:hypothetical protein